MYIELARHDGGKWHWRLKAGNHKILLSSETYFSKYNARRAAHKMAMGNGLGLKVRGD